MISVYQLSRPALDVAWRLLTPDASVAQAKDDWSIGNYELVADLLEVTDLEEAYHLTQTINRPWWQDARVTPRFAGHTCSGGCRSTSVGDLLIGEDGAHVVCNIGFAPVELPGVRPHGYRPETPEQAAKRLVERWGRVVAAETAGKRMLVHAPRKLRQSDLADDDRLAARRYQESTRSTETYEHWKAVATWIVRHLTEAERKQLGMKPKHGEKT